MANGRRPFKNGTVCTKEEGRTRQADLASSDINVIVKRFEQQGIVPLGSPAAVSAQYLDVSEVGTYREALDTVMRAEAYFDSLPAESRRIFNNDPAEFLDATNNPARLEDLKKAGIVKVDDVVQTANLTAPAATPPSSAEPPK